MKRIAIALTISLLSLSALAEDTSSPLFASRADVISSIFFFVILFAAFMGVILIAQGLIKIKDRLDDPRDPKNSPAKIITYMLIGGLLLSLNQTINLAVNLVTGEEEYCFALDKRLSNAAGNATKITVSDIKSAAANMGGSGCFDASTSALTTEMRQKIDAQMGGERFSFLNHLTLAIGVIQLIGVIFFLRGLLNIRNIGVNQDVKAGGIVIQLIASAAMIDIEHTLLILFDLAKSFGFSV